MSVGDVEIGRPDLRTAGMTIRPPRLRGPDGTAEHAFVAYRLMSGGHRQLGVVVELSVDDYRAGRIRRHEATDPERLRQVEESPAAGPVEPITVFHPVRPALRSLLAEATTGAPDLARAHHDGVSELGWIDHDRERAQALQDELTGLDAIYLADGHHRMAALARHIDRPGGPGAGFITAALFPADEMRILAYHRFLTRPDHLSTSELLDLLGRLPAAASVTECVPASDHEPAPGVVVLRLDGRWYRIGLRTPRHDGDQRRALDIVTLENGILAPILADLGAGFRVTAVPGASDTLTVGRQCDDRRAIGFLLHPPTVSQIITVADTGQTVPAKSTWFDPKPRPGLLHPTGTS